MASRSVVARSPGSSPRPAGTGSPGLTLRAVTGERLEPLAYTIGFPSSPDSAIVMPTGASFIARSLSRRSSTVSASFRSRAASRREVCRRSTRFPIRVRSARFHHRSSTTSSAWSPRGLRRRRRRVVAREQHDGEEGGRRAPPPRLDRSGDPVELAGAEDAAVERRFERSRVRRLDARNRSPMASATSSRSRPDRMKSRTRASSSESDDLPEGRSSSVPSESEAMLPVRRPRDH